MLVAVFFHVRPGSEIVGQLCQHRSAHPEVVRKPCVSYAHTSSQPLMFVHETNLIFIFSDSLVYSLLPYRIIGLIEHPRILTFSVNCRVAIVARVELVFIQLISEYQPLLINPVVRLMCFQASAPHDNTLPPLREWVILVVLSQRCQHHTWLLMCNQFFQPLLSDVGDILLYFTFQRANKSTYIRFLQFISASAFLIIVIFKIVGRVIYLFFFIV